MRDLELIAAECAEVAREAIRTERCELAESDRGDLEVLTDVTRDVVVDVLAGIDLTDGEYDSVRYPVLDMLRCNGDVLECEAAGRVADE